MQNYTNSSWEPNCPGCYKFYGDKENNGYCSGCLPVGTIKILNSHIPTYVVDNETFQNVHRISKDYFDKLNIQSYDDLLKYFNVNYISADQFYLLMREYNKLNPKTKSNELLEHLLASRVFDFWNMKTSEYYQKSPTIDKHYLTDASPFLKRGNLNTDWYIGSIDHIETILEKQNHWKKISQAMNPVTPEKDVRVKPSEKDVTSDLVKKIREIKTEKDPKTAVTYRIKEFCSLFSQNDKKLESFKGAGKLLCEKIIEIYQTEAPDEFLCPISFEQMTNPVTLPTADHAYEDKYLLSVLEGNPVCPLSGKTVEIKQVTSNRGLKLLIDLWKTEVKNFQKKHL